MEIGVSKTRIVREKKFVREAVPLLEQLGGNLNNLP